MPKIPRSISIDIELDRWLRDAKIPVSKECEEYLYSLSRLNKKQYQEYLKKKEILLVEDEIRSLKERLKELKK